MKRAARSDALGPSKKPKRHQVSLNTFTKWQAQLEWEHQTMTWLRFSRNSSVRPTLATFSSDRAVKLWWEDYKTTSRVNQAPKKKKEYRPMATSTESSSSGGPSSSEASSTDTEETLSLDDRDDLFNWSFRLTILFCVFMHHVMHHASQYTVLSCILY